MHAPHRPSRRDFMKSAAGAAAATASLTVLGAQPRGQARVFKVGLVGCGGRGSGAARDILQAAQTLGVTARITTLADAYRTEQLNQRITQFRNAGQEIPEGRIFIGLDAYRRVLGSDVDIVLLATPPVFRPLHFEAAVNARKHVFMEKPVAVDPPGCRRIIRVGQQARERNLCVVAGTQRRHEKRYIACKQVLDSGEIGEILGGVVYWCGSRLWCQRRQQGWSNRDYLIRNWFNFTQMSADHIVEQHVHNIDAANWYLGAHPELAVGFGARARRQTGNQFDFFSVDYLYDRRKQIHIHSLSRQINGCWNRVGECFTTERGYLGSGRIRLRDRRRVRLPDIPGHDNAYVQEHVALLQGILDPQNKYINETQHVAESTLTAIMGRISAYTGRAVRWSDVAAETGRFGNIPLQPTPEAFEQAAEVPVPREIPPVPGDAAEGDQPQPGLPV